MSTAILNVDEIQSTTNGWVKSNSHKLDILVTKEEDGTFSTAVLNLPGVHSCGDTELEAMEGIKDAFRGVFQSYVNDGDPIPWENSNEAEIPFASQSRKIYVNA